MTTTQTPAQYLSKMSGMDPDAITRDRASATRARNTALSRARRIVWALYMSHNDTEFAEYARRIGQAYEAIVEGLGRRGT